VEVAGSAAKCLLEPPAVTSSITRFILPELDGIHPSAPVGIVGLGTVGNDVARTLLRQGRQVSVFDKVRAVSQSVPGARWCSSLQELFERSVCILGCTGEDLFKNVAWIDELRGDRLLASCSSEDIEFRSLLKHRSAVTQGGPLDPIELPLRRGVIKVLRGGFPANFTGTKNSGSVSLIQVTRALLLAGVLQAAGLVSVPAHGLPTRIMLDPKLQAVVAQAFLIQGRRRLVAPAARFVQDVEWAAAHSTGRRVVPEA
jgi:hypothetical protein